MDHFGDIISSEGSAIKPVIIISINGAFTSFMQIYSPVSSYKYYQKLLVL